MLIDNIHIQTERLENNLLAEKNIKLFVARLDKIHPIISGNKLFKLYYFLQKAIQSPHKTVITFGGAYSNHLVATAYACKDAGIKSIGIVRGEAPPQLSQTSQHCKEYGMYLRFISRAEYDNKNSPEYLETLFNEFGEHILIPEGGFSETGAEGAANIMKYIDDDATHICCATGTSTTIAGILLQAKPHQKIIAVPVLKGITDIEDNIAMLTNNKANLDQLNIFDDYHFGGYAKYNAELISFMNNIYKQFNLPTDFVYTAKMFYAIFDNIKNGKFPEGSKIVCIHTGGLQGNASLKEGTLNF